MCHLLVRPAPGPLPGTGQHGATRRRSAERSRPGSGRRRPVGNRPRQRVMLYIISYRTTWKGIGRRAHRERHRDPSPPRLRVRIFLIRRQNAGRSPHRSCGKGGLSSGRHGDGRLTAGLPVCCRISYLGVRGLPVGDNHTPRPTRGGAACAPRVAAHDALRRRSDDGTPPRAATKKPLAGMRAGEGPVEYRSSAAVWPPSLTRCACAPRTCRCSAAPGAPGARPIRPAQAAAARSRPAA